MKFIKYLKYLISIALSIVVITSIQADITPTETYGLYNCLLPQYKHLSPFHGFIAHENDVFLYYYDYTQTEEPLHKLIHKLFWISDGKLKPFGTDREIANGFGPAEIGTMLAVIEKYSDSNGIITVSQEDLKRYLLEVVNSFKLNKKIREINKKEFIQILVDSLKNAGHWGRDEQHYPRYLVHDILLLFLFRKIDKKQDYMSYFNVFKTLNNNQGILEPNAESLLQKNYEDPNNPSEHTKNILENYKDNLSPLSQSAEYIMQHYELFGFAKIANITFDDTKNPYPPHIDYTSVLLSWYNNNPTYQALPEGKNGKEDYWFTDCMETALRNLVSFIVYDANTGEFKPLIPYFAQFKVRYGSNKEKNILGEQARIAWADLVSDIPLVEYNKRIKIAFDDTINANILVKETAKNNNNGKSWQKPAQDDGWYYYELEPTLPTIVTIVNHLFNLHLKDFGEFLTHFDLTCPSYKGTIEEQTTAICTISNANKKECTLNINPGHGEIEKYYYENSSKNKHNNQRFGELFPYNNNTLSLLNLYNLDTNDPARGINIFLNRVFFRMPLKNTPFARDPYWRYALLLQNLNNIEIKKELFSLFPQVHNVNELRLVDKEWNQQFIIKLAQSALKMNDAATTGNILKNWQYFAGRWGSGMMDAFADEFRNNFAILSNESKEEVLTYFYKQDANKYSPMIVQSFEQLDPEVQNNFLGTLYRNIYDDIRYKGIDPALKKELLASLINKSIAQMIAAQYKDKFYWLVSILIKTHEDILINIMTKKEIEQFIENILPHLSEKGLFNALLHLLWSKEYLGIDFVKNMLISSNINLTHDQKKSILEDLTKKKSLWGKEFIEQFETMPTKE